MCLEMAAETNENMLAWVESFDRMVTAYPGFFLLTLNCIFKLRGTKRQSASGRQSVHSRQGIGPLSINISAKLRSTVGWSVRGRLTIDDRPISRSPFGRKSMVDKQIGRPSLDSRPNIGWSAEFYGSVILVRRRERRWHPIKRRWLSDIFVGNSRCSKDLTIYAKARVCTLEFKNIHCNKRACSSSSCRWDTSPSSPCTCKLKKRRLNKGSPQKDVGQKRLPCLQIPRAPESLKMAAEKYKSNDLHSLPLACMQS